MNKVLFAGLLTTSAIFLTAPGARGDAFKGPPPPWLAQPAQSSAPSMVTTPPFRSIAFLGLLATLGGAALLARKKLSAPVEEAARPRLRVLDTIRLADKSHLVLTRVGERCLLLGVTSHSVRRIAWLRLTDAPGASRATNAAATSSGHDEPETGTFPGLLRQAFGQEAASQPAANESPAADEGPATLLAAETKDNVEPFSFEARLAEPIASSQPRGRSRSSKNSTGEKPVTSLIEAQASGLATRRRR